MDNIFIAIGICVISYFLGCFSSARVLAKSFKNLNIYKVGTGLADTHNIYINISKPLGVLATILDMGKMIVYIVLIKYLLVKVDCISLSTDTILFIFGFFLIAGHCLPVTHKFKGGRGINPYIGLMLFYIPYIMGIIFVLAFLIGSIFRQIRFAQYLVVLLPPIVCMFIPTIPRELNTLMVIAALLMGLFNFIVSKRLGEF